MRVRRRALAQRQRSAMSTATLPVFLALLSLGYGAKVQLMFEYVVCATSDGCVPPEVWENVTRRAIQSLNVGVLVCEYVMPEVFSEEIKEIIDHIHHECVVKTGASEEDIKNCENGIFKEDPKLKCYMFCLLEEASLADEDGMVDYEMMVSLIPDQYYDRVSKMIFSCKHLDTPDKDKCHKAFEVHKCSYDKDPDMYFLF